jgi:hypothetical protein
VEVDSGWLLGSLSTEGYRTEYKASQTCKDVGYTYEPSLAKCVQNLL